MRFTNTVRWLESNRRTLAAGRRKITAARFRWDPPRAPSTCCSRSRPAPWTRLDVTYVTPVAEVSIWTHDTMEQAKIQTRLLELGVNIVPFGNLVSIQPGQVELACVFTDRKETLACATVIMVTMRDSDDALYHDLMATPDNGLKSVTRIGDCLAPGTIAAAVFSGHRFAYELGEPVLDGVPFRRELPALADD